MLNELKSDMDNELTTQDSLFSVNNSQSKWLLTKSRFIGFYQAGWLRLSDLVTERYEFKDQIGSGTYGLVLKATNKKSGDTVAIKLIKKTERSTDNDIIEEVRNLIKLVNGI